MELILAAFLLAVVLTGMIQLFITCRYLNDSNRNMVVAASHAQFIMEDIIGSSASVPAIEAAINAGNWNLTSDDIQGAPYQFTPLTDESVTAQVSMAGDPLGFNVTVRWREGSMLDHDYVLQTLVAQ